MQEKLDFALMQLAHCSCPNHRLEDSSRSATIFSALLYKGAIALACAFGIFGDRNIEAIAKI